jgi:hypothetical protein
LQGPVDGSLYATIAKGSPNANTSNAISHTSNNNNNGNELTVQNIRTIETRLNTPVSKNSRILSTILEWDNARNENGHNELEQSSSYALATSNAVSTTRQPQQQQQQPIPPQRNYVKSPLMRSYDSGIYSHEVSNSKSIIFEFFPKSKSLTFYFTISKLTHCYFSHFRCCLFRVYL